jgi:hypothetical protein
MRLRQGCGEEGPDTYPTAATIETIPCKTAIVQGSPSSFDIHSALVDQLHTIARNADMQEGEKFFFLRLDDGQ